jgi:hypothetical protein
MEVWKDIIDWPFHQISNLGRVRVLPGGKVSSRLVVETELRVLTPLNGYMRIVQGKQMLYIHTLVLNAFAGPCPPGHECRHLNGDRSDNRWPENLAWGTLQENAQDRVRHGTSKGECNPGSKLTEADVVDIQTQPQYYGVVTGLAIKYGVAHSVISNIRRGKVWKHVS